MRVSSWDVPTLMGGGVSLGLDLPININFRFRTLPRMTEEGPPNMRPRSPDSGSDRPAKRQRRSGSFHNDVDAGPQFAANLLSASNVKLLSEQYNAAMPFKHVVIDKIFPESLLMRVKDEILQHLSFTEKETDIYKAGGTLHVSITLSLLCFMLFLFIGPTNRRPRLP